MTINETKDQIQLSKNNWLIGSLIFVIAIASIVYQIYKPTHNQSLEKQRLLNLDITSLLIEDNDLPTGYKSGNVLDIKSDSYLKFTQGKEQEIFTTDGTPVGTVSVFLFASEKEQNELYSLYSQVESQEGIIPYKVTGIGECESCEPIFSINGCDLHIVFNRCNAVGVIELNAACLQKEYDFDHLVAHAKRLDESLKSIVCY